MDMSIYGLRFRICLALLTLTVASGVVFAAAPSVTAVLSDSQPTVGQMVQLEIKVTGANSANVPQTISVVGLEIHQTRPARQFETRNFHVTSSATYNYTIMPQRAGTLNIPLHTDRVGS